MKYPTKPCCIKFENLRLRFINQVEALNRLSGGNPRILLILYEQLKTEMSLEMIERLATPESGCPCSARDEAIKTVKI